jgi:hypothetical protein
LTGFFKDNKLQYWFSNKKARQNLPGFDLF